MEAYYVFSTFYACVYTMYTIAKCINTQNVDNIQNMQGKIFNLLPDLLPFLNASLIYQQDILEYV